jgi:hypothetical protein
MTRSSAEPTGTIHTVAGRDKSFGLFGKTNADTNRYSRPPRGGNRKRSALRGVEAAIAPFGSRQLPLGVRVSDGERGRARFGSFRFGLNDAVWCHKVSPGGEGSYGKNRLIDCRTVRRWVSCENRQSIARRISQPSAYDPSPSPTAWTSGGAKGVFPAICYHLLPSMVQMVLRYVLAFWRMVRRPVERRLCAVGDCREVPRSR